MIVILFKRQGVVIMIAKELMTKDIITVKPDSTVDEAAKQMSEKNVSGIPVVDDDNKLVGIITEGDLLGKHKQLSPPGYIEFLGGIIFTESQEDFFNRLQKYVATQVKDIMTTNVLTVSPDTSKEEIATIMDREGIKRIPVVENDHLLGIVSRADLIKALL